MLRGKDVEEEGIGTYRSALTLMTQQLRKNARLSCRRMRDLSSFMQAPPHTSILSK